MGNVKTLMKPNCVPTKFECQKDNRKRRGSSSTEQPETQKQRTMTIAEYESIPSSSREDTSKNPSSMYLT